MTRGKKQRLFAKYFTILLQYMWACGYEVTFPPEHENHIENSFHYIGLAKDVNLFKDGKYLQSTMDHYKFGQFWKSLHPMCTWGGDFRKKDGNHYSFGEDRKWQK